MTNKNQKREAAAETGDGMTTPALSAVSDESSTAAAAPVDKASLKREWVEAQARVSVLEGEMAQAKARLGRSVKAIFEVVGPRFRHEGQDLTIVRRGETYFVKGRSEPQDIPEL